MSIQLHQRLNAKRLLTRRGHLIKVTLKSDPPPAASYGPVTHDDSCTFSIPSKAEVHSPYSHTISKRYSIVDLIQAINDDFRKKFLALMAQLTSELLPYSAFSSVEKPKNEMRKTPARPVPPPEILIEIVRYLWKSK